MKAHTKIFLLLCISIAMVSTSSFADKPYGKADSDIGVAHDYVIRVCNNSVGQFDLEVADVLSKKDWSKGEKANAMVLSHNLMLRQCIVNVIIGLKEYADGIPH